MEALNRILTKVKSNTTSHHCTNKKYNCELCKDTGFILIEKENSQPIAKQCICSNKSKYEKLWKEFGVDASKVKKINQYEAYSEATRFAKTKALNYIYNFEEIKKSENSWIAIMGQPGSGKSHLVIALGAALLEKGFSVMYMPYMESIQQLKGSASDFEKYKRILNRYMKSEILIIDDLFKDKIKNKKIIADLNEVDQKHIYQILNYRYYNNLPTIFSTECTPDVLIKLDTALAGRILERSNNNIIIFNDINSDYRLKKFNEKI